MEPTIREASPESSGGSKSGGEPFIGLRGRLNLTERSYLAGRGDIGGFGAGSELAYNLFGGIGCQLTPSVATEIGWRHLAMDYSKGGFVYDAETSGAYLGLRIRF